MSLKVLRMKTLGAGWTPETAGNHRESRYRSFLIGANWPPSGQRVAETTFTAKRNRRTLRPVNPAGRFENGSLLPSSNKFSTEVEDFERIRLGEA